MVIFRSFFRMFTNGYPQDVPKNTVQKSPIHRILRNARPTRRLPVGMIPAKNVPHREDSHQKNREKRDQMDEHLIFYPSNISSKEICFFYPSNISSKEKFTVGFLENWNGKEPWVSPKGINWEYCLWRTHDSISQHVPNSKIKDAQQLYVTHCKMMNGATKPYVRPIESIWASISLGIRSPKKDQSIARPKTSDQQKLYA